MSATITFSGVSTGTDFAAIVDGLVQAERFQITALESWKSEWEEKVTSIQGLNTRLASYESSVASINSESEFMATSATSSDEDVVQVTSSSSAYSRDLQY